MDRRAQHRGHRGRGGRGPVGTVVFSAIDIVLLRPFKAYPWTWDAIGGGSTWWYLPIWWMLGTFLAWMGGIVTAAGSEATLGRRARSEEHTSELQSPCNLACRLLLEK